QRSGTQTFPCRGSLRSGQSAQFTRGERASPSRCACAKLDYSTLGDTSGGGLREGLCCAKQAAPGWTLCARRGSANACSPEKACGLYVEESVTVDVHQQGSGGDRWTHVLRGGSRGHLPAGRILRGQDPQGC